MKLSTTKDSNKPSIIAVIPFRQGSKGLIDKNIMPVKGIPLFRYSTEFAQRLGLPAVVSTDYDESKIRSHLRDERFVARPAELASDSSVMGDVIEHIIDHRDFESFTHILLLQPTSPLRSVKVYEKLYRAYTANGGSGIALTVRAASSQILKIGVIEDNKLINVANKNDFFFQNRQELPKVYAPDGNMYLFSVSEFKRKSMFPSDIIVPVVNDDDFTIDIDSQSDVIQLNTYLHNKPISEEYKWIESLSFLH